MHCLAARRGRIPPNLFGIALGIAGLAQAWHAAVPVLGTAQAVPGALDVLAAAVWLVLVGVLAFLFLRFTRPGRFVYGIGDNPMSARITGVPARSMMVLQYLVSSLIAFIAGVVTATLVNSMNTRVASSTLVYDVILVVAIGGVSLSGGKGGVRNVIVGTLLIGTLLNGMTIMDMSYSAQNVVKGIVLLIAILIDSFLNPRNEETAQQGDI